MRLRALQIFRSLARHSVVCTMLTALGLTSPHAFAQYGPVDPFASSYRQMRETLEPRQNGSHHTLLVALRQLDDPALKPFFECLLRAEHWSIRVDGVLGLAELSPSHTVDPSLIEKLPEDADRDNAIQAALAINLIGAQEALVMAEWEDLDGRARAVLCGEAQKDGVTPSAALRAKLLASRTPEVAAIGAAFSLSIGELDEAALRTALDAIAALNPRTRAATLTELSAGIVRFQLKGTGELLTRALELKDLTAESRARLIIALLVVDAAKGIEAWRATVATERTQLALVRAAHVLLVSGARATAADWDLLRNQDPLLEGIATAGASFSKGELNAFYGALLALGHRQTLAAALDGSPVLGVDAERALGEASLAVLLEQSAVVRTLGDGLLRAVARLAELSPESFRAALETAKLDVPLTELLLFALAEAGTKAAADVAQIARDGASARAESLIRILHARHATQLAEPDLLYLSKIGGAGDPAVSIQAAWLWLRFTGRAQECVEKLCAEINGTSAATE